MERSVATLLSGRTDTEKGLCVFFFFSGGASSHVRQRAGVRRGIEDPGTVARAQACQHLLRNGTSMGRRVVSHQLHQLGEFFTFRSSFLFFSFLFSFYGFPFAQSNFIKTISTIVELLNLR